jgi:type VI protein secretion system component VasF
MVAARNHRDTAVEYGSPMARHRGRSHSRTPIRSPYRQPIWLIVGVSIIALGTIVLVVAAFLTFGR